MEEEEYSMEDGDMIGEEEDGEGPGVIEDDMGNETLGHRQRNNKPKSNPTPNSPEFRPPERR